MLKQKWIEPAAAGDVDGDDARTSAGEPDRTETNVSVRDRCVVLEIGCAVNGERAVAPVLLSAAASRALAADLMAAADSVEPVFDQD
jgi:hypothetical protein